MEGLSSAEARKRLERYGRNEIVRTEKESPFRIFVSQFTSPLVLLLLGAAAISLFLGSLGFEDSVTDAILIGSIVFLSGVLGFFQEYRTEKTIETLREMSTPKARVYRDGVLVEIPTTEVVPGDLAVLEAGDVVPADGRVLEAEALKIDESVLTGESRPVKKSKGEAVFMNTFVLSGSGKILIERTGMRTEVGKIADTLQKIKKDKTPFQEEMERFGSKTFRAIVALSVAMALVGITKFDPYTSVLIAISLAVAAIPEGLPVVVTLALAAGAKTMASKNALVRKLSAVESIGSVDVICTDKTGTVTKGEMSVSSIALGTGGEPDLEKILTVSAVCNDSLEVSGRIVGDETDIALRNFAENRGVRREAVEKENPRIKEIPFSSKRKMMTVVLKSLDVYTKGAPENVLRACDRILENGRVRKLGKRDREKILEEVKNMASKGLRVIAFAWKKAGSRKDAGESGLVWLGMAGLEDPPRPGVKRAIRVCESAGIRVIMLTGDNPFTAEAIAREIGLKSERTVTGPELDGMGDAELERVLDSGANIFARISPFHKLRILEVLKRKRRVAMTGDGVNDALALKKADVGISMGLRGTEVARESSDMVLLDDDFSTIQTAVKEGRRIFDNIRKFVNYLFVSNFAEVAVIFLFTVFLAFSEPVLLPVHILWINLLTDGLPAIALGLDPASKDIMKRPPRKKGEPVINRRIAWLIVALGAKKTVALITLFFILLPLGFETARTGLFTGFIIYEFVRIGSIRATEKIGWLENRWLIYALAGSLALQVFVIYGPLAGLFRLAPLGVFEWLVILGISAVDFYLAILMTRYIVRKVKP